MMIELKPVEYETAFTRSKQLGRKITDEMKIQIKKNGASYNFFNFVPILLYNALVNKMGCLKSDLYACKIYKTDYKL